jgi:hypothetical protein
MPVPRSLAQEVMRGAAMRSFARIAMMIALAACTHHHRVAALHPVSTTARATVELDDGREVVARAVPTPAGSRWLAGSEVGRSGALIEPAGIRRVTTIDHARGAWEGLGFGLLAGITTGAVIGLASGDDHCSANGFCLFQFSAGDKAILGGIVVGGAGLVLGGLLGAVIGSRDVYELDASYLPRISTAIAPGHVSAGLTWSF